MGVITIPGNIKQQYLPFVLKPDNPLNKNAEDSKSLREGGAGAQCFSFRRKKYESEYKAGFGLLNVCPSSFREVDFGGYMEKDVSFRTLFGQIDPKTGKPSEEKLTVDALFDAMPGVQIREYLPDTRMDQMFNFIGEVVRKCLLSNTVGATAAAGGAGLVDTVKWAFSGGLKEWLANPDLLAKLKLSLWYLWDWLASNPTANGRNLIKLDGQSRFTNAPGNGLGVYGPGKSNFDIDDAKLLSLPFAFYYMLQSAVTTNVYELPCHIDTAFDVHGKEGWGGSSVGVGGDDPVNKFVSKMPIVGKLVNMMFSNVRVNYMNWWDSKSGSKTMPPDVTVKFSLFNDTADRAMTNFIFVNTIAPNNMWVQYGIFQHSSCVYDVKIEGHSRLFACAGDVKVSYRGVLRNPPPGWVHRLVSTYGNGAEDKEHGRIDKAKLEQNILDNNLIKIPDVYEVELAFRSMLPQNLNTYLYQYSQNQRIENMYMDGSVFNQSVLAEHAAEMAGTAGGAAVAAACCGPFVAPLAIALGNVAGRAMDDLDDYNRNWRDKDLQAQKEKEAAQSSGAAQ